MRVDSISGFLEEVLENMITQEASDLYLTVGFPPAYRIGDKTVVHESAPLGQQDIDKFIDELLDEIKKEEFLSTLELNMAFEWKQKSRFRLNLFRQQYNSGMVIRRIRTDVPSLESLGLPEIYAKLAMRKRGLILIASPSGSGKSTSVAAMLGYRNAHGSGHILTIEDPIEFIHEHNKCIFTQREVGIDTYSYGMALKNALRQRADVVVIGEVRDRETMEHAINFAETGHLCIATLHANNAAQAIERVVNFFPEEYHRHVLSTLSQNLEAIVSQKIVNKKDGGRALAIEIMLNIGLIKTLINDGRVIEIRDHMEKHLDLGMRTFDSDLLQLFQKGVITEEVAIAEAENSSTLKLRIRQNNASTKFSLSKPMSDF